MLKRTKIYLVLTLLVLTGFAGSLNSGSLSSKERKYLVSDLKESKQAFLQTVKDLSERQLNFKSSKNGWSAREYASYLVTVENRLWQIAGTSSPNRYQSVRPKSIKLSDDRVMEMSAGLHSYFNTRVPVKNMDETMHDFKRQRASLLRFVKTTTDDLRSSVKELSFGTVDSYQLLMMITSQTWYVTRQIEEIKSNPNFPK